MIIQDNIAPRLIMLLEADIENAAGADEERCSRCGSWVAHWENLSGCKRDACAKKGCPSPATDGAHIYADGNCFNIYIVPSCHACSTRENGEFEIRDDIAPVSVGHPEDE